jgi:hypothetical protein
MPTGTHDHLQQLYDREKLLGEEASRLETERESLETDSKRTYILDIEIIALREESTRINQGSGPASVLGPTCSSTLRTVRAASSGSSCAIW